MIKEQVQLKNIAAKESFYRNSSRNDQRTKQTREALQQQDCYEHADELEEKIDAAKKALVKLNDKIES